MEEGPRIAFIYLLYVHGCFGCMHKHAACACSDWGPEDDIESPRIGAIMSTHEGAGNPTQFSAKSASALNYYSASKPTL